MNTLVDYGVFVLLHALLGVNYLLAQTASFACGTINSYLVNRTWTFGRRGRADKAELLKFLAVNGLMFGLSTAILVVCEEWLGWNALIGKAISIVIATGIGFILNRLWVFRESGASAEVTKVAKLVETNSEQS
ncbi:GtrA family protein [Paenibacillus albicereus]|uniref:GtrA family protein n=2 Tax=Paenibacillus albicereus TaxID=2726185 RepID=A0A6H2H174_9BACL|nr:GtrA family protein [Paenibacillus albicereus]